MDLGAEVLGIFVVYQPISITALIEAVWGDDPPSGATRSLRTYASNLRSILGPAVELRGGQASYTLDAQAVRTDIDEFREIVREALGLEEPRERCNLLNTALDLWRGPFLADLDRSLARDTSTTLDWERRRATAAWADATIDAGRPEDALAVLERSVADSPLDEQTCGLLMRAL